MSFTIESKTRAVVEGYSPSSFASSLEPGCYHRISHQSSSTSTKMIFGLFLPSCYKNDGDGSSNTPVMYFLSGLTCDDTNFAMKAGSRAFDVAEKHGMAIVMPDTSPRSRHDDENSVEVPNVDSYDFGIGAGFYVNATTEPYSQHYQMYDYVTKDLTSLLENDMNIGKDGLKSISGHSMGGHGALVIALREGKYSWKSVSAFAPIANPVDCPWGKKAFEGYLGSVDAGKVYDASLLVASLQAPMYDEIMIDQGTADNFLVDQLKPEVLAAAAKKSGQNITINMRNGFDHSYYFIAEFIENHVNFHAKYLS
jgi:S-formylglutathione hydrolase